MGKRQYETACETYVRTAAEVDGIQRIIDRRKGDGWRLHAASKSAGKTKLTFRRPVSAPRGGA
ncbi:MAG: hypothetical protein ACLPVF_11860 [Acidimicrobiales bacterium]